MCTAVFCGHALGEKCPHPFLISLKIKMKAETSNSHFGPEAEIGICKMCWFNLQKYLPGFFRSTPAWEKAS